MMDLFKGQSVMGFVSDVMRPMLFAPFPPPGTSSRARGGTATPWAIQVGVGGTWEGFSHGEAVLPVTQGPLDALPIGVVIAES